MILDSPLPAKTVIANLGVIPARLLSTRLPRKVLRQIAGRPMLAWVYEAAAACPALDRVIVATDAEEVAELCQQQGWPCMLTSADLLSGTDRVHAVAQAIEAAIYVNIQGDEPMLHPRHVEALLQPFARGDVQVSTLRVACTPEEVGNPNAVKVVTSKAGQALYFSRSAIPFDRDGTRPMYWKHLGLYAYRRSILQQFPTLPTSDLERSERLEQLRFLENGIGVQVMTTEIDTVGVDTEEDLQRVESILIARGVRRP